MLSKKQYIPKPINGIIPEKRKYNKKRKRYTIEEHYDELGNYYNSIGHIIYN
jgi:hypothetical protein